MTTLVQEPREQAREQIKRQELKLVPKRELEARLKGLCTSRGWRFNQKVRGKEVSHGGGKQCLM